MKGEMSDEALQLAVAFRIIPDPSSLIPHPFL
jgi:hypothetical protein